MLNKAIDSFKKEAETLFELGKHPQIPDLLAFFEQENRLYLVQECINGHDLFKELSQKNYFSEAEINQFLFSLLPVLHFVHQRKIIHRDIKPENIICRQDGVLILVDFGVSKQLTSSITTRIGTTTGTLGYAPPEQLRGRVYPASDLYALGITAIRLLTGCVPTQQNNAVVDEIYDSLEMEWTWQAYLEQQGREISPNLAQILVKLTHEKVKLRYQTAEDILQELNGIKKNVQGIVGTRQPLPLNPLPPPPLLLEPRSMMVAENRHFQGHALKDFAFEVVTVKMGHSRLEYTINKRESAYFTLDLWQKATLDMIAIPPGRYLRGSSDDELGSRHNERPEHWVEIPPFYRAHLRSLTGLKLS